MNARDLPYCPIIREAIAANDLTPKQVLADKAWQSNRSPFLTSATRMDRPFMFFDAGGGSIDWGRNGISFHFYKSKDTYRFYINAQDYEFPKSVLEALIGETLDKAVNLPGGEGMRIMAIENLREIDDTIEKGYRIHIEPLST